jgi:hypothetical protein
VPARAWLWLTVALTGGAFAVAAALAPPASAAPDRGLAWVLFAGSSAHVASTGWLYTLGDVRSYAASRPLRLRWVPAAFVLSGALAAALLRPAGFAWLLLPFFGWQFFHFAKQNLGMVALAASSAGVTSPRPAERRALLAAGVAGIGGLIARPALLQLRVDPRLGAMFGVAALAFAAAVVAGVALLARRPAAQRPAGFSVMYLMALLFSLPVFIFGSPYAAVGGMTAAHGMQYLLLVGLVAAGSGGRLVRLAVLCNVALLGGAALERASHLHGAAPAERLLFGAYLGAVMAHFVIDAGLWRLRDPFPRAFLARRVPYLVPGRPPAAATGQSPAALLRTALNSLCLKQSLSSSGRYGRWAHAQVRDCGGAVRSGARPGAPGCRARPGGAARSRAGGRPGRSPGGPDRGGRVQR